MHIQISGAMVRGQKCDVMASDSLLTLCCPSASSVDTNTSNHFQLRPAPPPPPPPPTCLSKDIRAPGCCVSRLGSITVLGSVYHRRQFVDADTSSIFWLRSVWTEKCLQPERWMKTSKPAKLDQLWCFDEGTFEAATTVTLTFSIFSTNLFHFGFPPRVVSRSACSPWLR